MIRDDAWTWDPSRRDHGDAAAPKPKRVVSAILLLDAYFGATGNRERLSRSYRASGRWGLC